MMKNKIFITGLFVIALVVLYFSFFDGGNTSSADSLSESVNPEAYRQQVAEDRKKKDEFFRTDSNSPISNKADFRGLSYFQADLSYRVMARLEPFADKTQKLVVRMSDGSEEVYDKFAHVVFKLNDETCRLLVVKLENTYSILFRDGTSGKETYGGGRYLEIDPASLTNNGAILDFNKAYNPYCAYNPTYSCPIPPAENTLSTPVKAGEKYH